MVATLARVLDMPIRYAGVPEAAAGEWMTRAGLPPALVAVLVETLGGIRTNEFAHVAGTVRRLTGQPGHTFEEWCQEHRSSFRAPR